MFQGERFVDDDKKEPDVAFLYPCHLHRAPVSGLLTFEARLWAGWCRYAHVEARKGKGCSGVLLKGDFGAWLCYDGDYERTTEKSSRTPAVY